MWTLTEKQISNIKIKIEVELGTMVEITSIDDMGFNVKDIHGNRFFNKLTKTGKHKKNSTRLFAH